jgi:hypothetical protein
MNDDMTDDVEKMNLIIDVLYIKKLHLNIYSKSSLYS